MITDFCNTLWDTRIESDTVSCDGYEVSNLISRDLLVKQRGFLAERFVKPVVSILMSFPFPVDICAINVNPRVGGQKISGLEILSASLSYRNTKKTNARECEQVLHAYPHTFSVNNIKKEFNSCFSQVLRVSLAEGKVGRFVNPCFGEFTNVDFESKIINPSTSNIQMCNLQQGNRLHCTSHLWVRITQVHKGSVPCLGALEIVGIPAKNNDQCVKHFAQIIILKLKLERERKSCGNSSTEISLSAKQSPETSEHVWCNNASSLADNLPPEFIDPITLNVMTLPILLPSGNTIDNSTLEKHIAMERTWGRQPCDPFTGIPLGSKLIPNAALKYRIDNFLLSTDINVDKLGRTIGSLSDCKSTAKLKFDAILKQDKMVNKRKAGATSITQPASKRKHAENDVHVLHKPSSLDKALESVLSFRQKSGISSSVITSSLVSSSSLNQVPEAEVREQNGNSSISSDINNEGCSHRNQLDILFQLPCQHVICRACLTCAVELKQCFYCLAKFEKKEVVCVHSRCVPRIETCERQ